jgi:hypothetical protein
VGPHERALPFELHCGLGSARRGHDTRRNHLRACPQITCASCLSSCPLSVLWQGLHGGMLPQRRLDSGSQENPPAIRCAPPAISGAVAPLAADDGIAFVPSFAARTTRFCKSPSVLMLSARPSMPPGVEALARIGLGQCTSSRPLPDCRPETRGRFHLRHCPILRVHFCALQMNRSLR